MEVSRRAFAASLAASASPLLAGQEVRLGVIGTGGRGKYLMSAARKAGGARFVAVADAWDKRCDEAASVAGSDVAKYQDYRRVLEHKDVDAVIIATMDHLHVPIAIDAVQAGKDVYVEKPMSSVPEQGPKLVKAVRASDRVVQVGLQQRSMAHFIEAKQRFFDSGAIGKVHLVRTIWNANSGYLSPVPAGMEEKPAGLDWDACLGWLPKRAWDPKMYFNRFAYWDIATGGQTGGLFSHWVDVAHWYLNLRRPSSAVAMSGIYRYDDGRDTPDTVNLILDYPEKVQITFEATLIDSREATQIAFMGSEGRLLINRSGYEYISKDRNAEPLKAGRSPEESHMANWLECILTRKQPNSNVVDGHYGAMACHIGNLADREKRRVVWKEEWDV